MNNNDSKNNNSINNNSSNSSTSNIRNNNSRNNNSNRNINNINNNNDDGNGNNSNDSNSNGGNDNNNGNGNGNIDNNNSRIRVSICNISHRANIYSKLKCLNTNAQSLMYKLNELESELKDKSIQIAAITETWAQEWKSALYEIEGFTSYMKNRENGKKGGGCALYIRNNLKSYACKELENMPGDDIIWCWVKPTDDTKVLVGCTYRSPSSNEVNNQNVMAQIRRACDIIGRGGRILMMGDFNLKEIHWTEDYAEGDTNSLPYRFYECIKDCFLYQHVTAPTRFRGEQNASTLDLIFTKEEDDVKNIEVFAPLGKSDHGIITFDFICKWKSNKIFIPRRLYFKGNYDEMNKLIGEVNWDALFEGKSLQEKWKIFKRKINEIADICIPMSKPMRRYAPWMNRKVVQAQKKKYFSWKRYMENRSSIRWREYVKERNKYSTLERDERRIFERSLAENMAQNFDTKPFFKYVNSKLTVRPEISALTNEEGQTIFDDKEMCNISNKYFHSVFNQPDNNEELPEMEQICEEVIGNIEVTPDMVQKQLEKLNKFKACGPDNMHPHILNATASTICYPLSKIFNESLQCEETPEDWRVANVTPIFKKGDRCDPANYRPVSLTSQVCKVLESIVKEKVFEHLTKHNLLNEAQHGFRQGRSCLSNLLTTLEDWTTILDQRDCVDAAYLDFRKAFDLVSHKHLLLKLEKYGIKGQIGKWIQAFLENRKQRVVIRGAESDELSVLSGVPQGSVLGPILFLIYINDLPKCVECPVCLFADDSKIYCRVPNSNNPKPELQNAHSKLQKDLNELHTWANKWKMSFNTSKCRVMHLGYGNTKHEYTLNGEVLQETTEEKDLGILIDNELTFSKHIRGIVAKANRMLGLIRISFESLEENENVKMFSSLYNTLIRPLLEYCVQAWSPRHKKDILLLENVQRRATKLVRQYKDLPYEERLKRLNLTKLEDRRERGDMILAYRLINGHEDIDYRKFFTLRDSPYNLRGHSKTIEKSNNRLNVRTTFFSNRIVNKWNSLSEYEIAAPSTSAFKKRFDKMEKNRRGI